MKESISGGSILNKTITGNVLGVLSILTVIVSVALFLILRGPNADAYPIIIIFSILSVIGIILAILSAVLSKRYILLTTGLLGNGAVLVFTYFLLLAMGIGEA